MSETIELRAFEISDAPEELRADLAGSIQQGVTGTIDGRVVGYAGIREVHGRHFGFFHITDERARQPFLVHRAVKASLDAAEAVGITPIFTFCDERYQRARAWLIRLGFRELVDGERDPVIAATEETTGHRVWIRERKV